MVDNFRNQAAVFAIANCDAGFVIIGHLKDTQVFDRGLSRRRRSGRRSRFVAAEEAGERDRNARNDAFQVHMTDGKEHFLGRLWLSAIYASLTGTDLTYIFIQKEHDEFAQFIQFAAGF